MTLSVRCESPFSRLVVDEVLVSPQVSETYQIGLAAYSYIQVDTGWVDFQYVTL